MKPNRAWTIFARAEGAVAAPTAGLHFTPALLAALSERSIGWTTLTLHVGPGTFLPVKTADPRDHKVHEIRARVYTLRVQQETSAMSRGVYTWAAAESRSVITGKDLLDVYHEIAGGQMWWVPPASAASPMGGEGEN